METSSSPENPSIKLEEMAKDAAQEGGAASFMNPGAKRGRPKGSKGKKARLDAKEPDQILPPPDPEKEREALKPVIAPVFKLLSMAGVKAAEDERAAIAPEQQELMTHCAAGTVVRYMPGVSEHADLICLSLMMSQWVMTVFMLRRENLEKMRTDRMNGHARPVEPSVVVMQ